MHYRTNNLKFLIFKGSYVFDQTSILLELFWTLIPVCCFNLVKIYFLTTKNVLGGSSNYNIMIMFFHSDCIDMVYPYVFFKTAIM